MAAFVLGCGAAAPASESTVDEPAASGSPELSPVESSVEEGDPPGIDTLLGVTLVTVSDRIRVRSAPRVSDDSIKYEPLLPLGTSLYAFSGPVYESGYEWYEVASVSIRLEDPGCVATPAPCPTVYTGWAARQGRDGEPWLEAGDAQCPAVPTDVGSVLAATAGARLACFPQVPITFQARLIECACDVDGGGFEPAWFGVDDQPLVLVPPSETWPPTRFDLWLVATMDPAGRYPDPLPIDQIVQVTGMFDHPDAMDCRYQGLPTDTAGPPTPSSACRFIFATTAISAIGS